MRTQIFKKSKNEKFCKKWGKTAKSKRGFNSFFDKLRKEKRLFGCLLGLFIPLFSSLKYGLEKGKNATCVCWEVQENPMEENWDRITHKKPVSPPF